MVRTPDTLCRSGNAALTWEPPTSTPTTFFIQGTSFRTDTYLQDLTPPLDGHFARANQHRGADQQTQRPA